jgi:DNA repair protein RecO (recombination protein O)
MGGQGTPRGGGGQQPGRRARWFPLRPDVGRRAGRGRSGPFVLLAYTRARHVVLLRPPHPVSPADRIGTGCRGPFECDREPRPSSQAEARGTFPRVSQAGHRTESVVVRVVEFGETSQVVHLVTPARGLVAALAKGAHAPKGAFQGGLTLGVVGEADLLVRPRAELELLRAFRVTDGLRGLRERTDRHAAGGYVLGLLRELSRPALPAPALFAAGTTALRAIATCAPERIPMWIVVFEARALAAAGHRPHLDRCVVCGGALDATTVFAPAAGGTAHGACRTDGPRRPLSSRALAALLRLYTARLPELVGEPLSAADVRTVRGVHDLFLPFVLDREPRGLRRIPRDAPDRGEDRGA